MLALYYPHGNNGRGFVGGIFYVITFVTVFLVCSAFQTLESLDGGKPFLPTLFVDLQGTIKTLRYFAGYADKIHGTTIPMGEDGLCSVHHLRHTSLRQGVEGAHS